MELKVEVWTGERDGSEPAVAINYRPGTGAGAYWNTLTGEYALRRADGTSVPVAGEVVSDFLRRLCDAEGLPLPDRNEVSFDRNGRPSIRRRHLYAMPLCALHGQWFSLMPLSERDSESLVRAVHLGFGVPMEAFAGPQPLRQKVVVSPDAPSIFWLARTARSLIPDLSNLQVWLWDCDAMAADPRGGQTLAMLHPCVTEVFIPRSRWIDDKRVYRTVCTVPCADYSGIPGMMQLEF